MKRRWDVLEGWVKANGWTRGAELGVFRGATFLHLLRRCSGLTLIGVDTWTPQPDKQLLADEGGRSYEAHDLAGYERDVRAVAAGFGSRAVIHKGLTIDVADRVADASLDFVFIDADHLEEGVRADIYAWRPKIRSGGVLCGHDYHPDFPGVIRAVDDLCPGFTLHDDTVWAVTV
jgi:hypothetical protein